MTEEIKYYKEKEYPLEWIPAEETPQQTIARLEQENKELKIYIESNKQQVEDVETLVMDNDRLQQEVENLKDTIYYDVEKYRSALEKINKIAELRFVNGLNKEADLYNLAMDRIQDKINEVLK